jgi:hypothetical protein
LIRNKHGSRRIIIEKRREYKVVKEQKKEKRFSLKIKCRNLKDIIYVIRGNI